MTKSMNATVFKILLTVAVVPILILALSGKAKAEDVNILQINPINIQGDTIYLLSRQDFGMGIGWNVASIADVVEVRAETVFPIVGDGSASTLLGAGIGVNIPKLIEKLGGTWILENITSSIGVLALYDFNADEESEKIEPAIYLTIIKVNF